MILTFTLKNDTAKSNWIPLLYEFSYSCKNELRVEIIDHKNNKRIDYNSLVKRLPNIHPIEARILSSTNNRQLNFLMKSTDSEGLHTALIPKLNPNLTPRGKYDNKIWTNRKWNIADTNETFIMDGFSFIQIEMKPFQKFEIEIELLTTTTKNNLKHK
jgi:hypothetical protein